MAELQVMSKEDQIKSEWKAFSKTEAFKGLLTYSEDIDKIVLGYAKDRSMVAPNGETVPIDNDTIASFISEIRGREVIISFIKEQLNPTQIITKN